MRTYFMMALFLLAACTAIPKGPAQDVYAAESTYVVALKLEIKYCGKGSIIKICSQVRVADDIAWVALQNAEKAARTPGFDSSKLTATIATARGLTDAFGSIANLLENK